MSKDYSKVNHVQQYGTYVHLRNVVKLNIAKEIKIFQFPFFVFSCFPALIFRELSLSFRAFSFISPPVLFVVILVLPHPVRCWTGT
jgi:hypothetical protein